MEGKEEGFCSDVVIPKIVMDCLESPDLFACSDLKSDDGVCGHGCLLGAGPP